MSHFDLSDLSSVEQETRLRVLAQADARAPFDLSAGPVIRASLIRFTRVFNLSGHPAASIPCGFTAGGLPVGLQIVGRPFDEATVLRVADAYQRATDWHRRRPVV